MVNGMLPRSARATCMVLVLSTVMLGVCPLAPALASPAAHGAQCPSKGMPAGHSCCVSGHHQPALLRSALEAVVVIFIPASGWQTTAAAAGRFAGLAALITKSPPWFSRSVLRI
jgi:hypothetical protein